MKHTYQQYFLGKDGNSFAITVSSEIPQFELVITDEKVIQAIADTANRFGVEYLTTTRIEHSEIVVA